MLIVMLILPMVGLILLFSGAFAFGSSSGKKPPPPRSEYEIR